MFGLCCLRSPSSTGKRMILRGTASKGDDRHDYGDYDCDDLDDYHDCDYDHDGRHAREVVRM